MAALSEEEKKKLESVNEGEIWDNDPRYVFMTWSTDPHFWIYVFLITPIPQKQDFIDGPSYAWSLCGRKWVQNSAYLQCLCGQKAKNLAVSMFNPNRAKLRRGLRRLLCGYSENCRSDVTPHVNARENYYFLDLLWGPSTRSASFLLLPCCRHFGWHHWHIK